MGRSPKRAAANFSKGWRLGMPETQCALRERRIVPNQVKLGVAGLRKEWLVGVRDHDLTASEL